MPGDIEDDADNEADESLRGRPRLRFGFIAALSVGVSILTLPPWGPTVAPASSSDDASDDNADVSLESCRCRLRIRVIDVVVG